MHDEIEQRRKRLAQLDRDTGLAAENERQKKQLAERERLIKQLEERIEHLTEEKKAMEEENKELKSELARVQTTSRNSSKRPSSDIVKPRTQRRGSGRKIGAQPGHKMHDREPFKPEEIDRTVHHALTCCPDCQGAVQKCRGMLPAVVQQMEVVTKLIDVTEHKGDWAWCEKCQKLCCPLPAEVEAGGLCGPVLTAWIGYLKGGCHASFSTIRKFLRDILGVRISRGMLAKVVSKVSGALADPWEELRQVLPLAKVLNVDETGHKDNGHLYRTWCFRAREYTLFKITESRSTAELLEMLGADFGGLIGCDYFSSYRCYMEEFGGVLQFCLAHLIREVKFLLELPDAETKAYGQRFLDSLRDLFTIIHKREKMPARGFRQRLEAQRETIIRTAVNNVPTSREAQNLAQRMWKHGDSYFQFITTPGVEPTNNLAEQAIRFVVIDRHVTQGTRGEQGRNWCQRIWTIMATCAQQGRSAFHFIHDAVQAYFNSSPAPSLATAPT
jgi:transposase